MRVMLGDGVVGHLPANRARWDSGLMDDGTVLKLPRVKDRERWLSIRLVNLDTFPVSLATLPHGAWDLVRLFGEGFIVGLA